MNTPLLFKTARAMVAEDRGLLAMDESTGTCNARFATLRIPQTKEYRCAYRELLATTPGLERFINGAILSDETIRQQSKDHHAFVDLLTANGILAGIKVDKGTVELAGFGGEKITEGLDGLGLRLIEYKQLGARFAKWRAVISMKEGLPSWACIQANAHALARYAAICQQAEVVPMVEPEVLMDGNHSIDACKKVTKNVLYALFEQLHQQHVNLNGMVLKPNMVLPGKDCLKQVSANTVAEATLETLLACVPAAVPGIAFLSGGQSSSLATERLNAMHRQLKSPLPWALTFSFARALQYPAIEIWNGKSENTVAAQQAFIHRAWCNTKANRGAYSGESEAPF